MKVVSYRDLKPRKGIRFSRVHILRLMKGQKFPQSFKIGDHSAVWDEAEIDEWLEKRAAQRAASQMPSQIKRPGKAASASPPAAQRQRGRST
jgi:predicted DNA-binding transcriptional regulator AlpA